MSEVVDDRGPVTAVVRQVDPRLERSLFRAVAKGRVPSSKRDGVTVVSLADVRAWAERRAAAQAAATAIAGTAPGTVTDAALPSAPPSAHGVSGRNGGVRAASGPVLDAADYARLFTLFKRGFPPEEIVEREGFTPDAVELGRAKLDRLQALSRDRVDVLATMEQRLAEIEEIAQGVDGFTLTLQERIVGLESALRGWRQWSQQMEGRLSLFEQALQYLAHVR